MKIVLITNGKHESIDYATVRIFPDTETAEQFCEETNTGPRKYWTKAEIVKDGESIELNMPEGVY